MVDKLQLPPLELSPADIEELLGTSSEEEVKPQFIDTEIKSPELPPLEFSPEDVDELLGGGSVDAFNIPTEQESLDSRIDTQELSHPEIAISGTAKGLSNILGAPADIIEGGLRGLASIGEEPGDILASDIPEIGKLALYAWGKGLNALGIKSDFDTFLTGSEEFKDIGRRLEVIKQPTTPLGRIEERVFEEVGTAILPTFALLKKANLASKSKLLQRIAQNPSRFTKIEAAAAIGGGLGAGVARETFPESPAAEVTGTIGGSILATSPLTPIRLAIGAGRLLLPLFGRAGRQALVERQVGSILKRNLAGDLKDVTKTLEDIDVELGLTTAEAAGDVGIEGISKKFSEMSPTFNKKLNEIQAAQIEGIDQSIRGVFQRDIDEAAKDFDISDINKLDAEDISEEFKTELIKVERENHEIVSNLFNQVDPTNSTSFNTDKITSAARGILKDIKKADDPANIPSLLDQIIGDSERAFKKVESYSEVKALRSRITTNLRQASGATAETFNAQKVRNLNLLLKSVDKTLEDLATGVVKGDPSVVERYSRARAARAEHADLFGKGRMKDLLRRTKTGEEFIPGSETIRDLFTKKGKSKPAFEQVEKVIAKGDLNKSRTLIKMWTRKHLLNTTRDASTGIISGTKLKAFVNNNKEALERYVGPNASENINKFIKEIELVDNRIPQLKGKGEKAPILTMPSILSRLYAYERGVVGGRFLVSEAGARLLNRVLDTLSEKEVDLIMSDALVNPKRAAYLLRKVDDSNAKGLAMAVRTHLVSIIEDDSTTLEE